MTNFEFFKTKGDAIRAYSNSVEPIYNIDGGKSGTSAGRFLDYLYEEHVEKKPDDNETVKEMLLRHKKMLEDGIWSANLSDSTDGMKAKLELVSELLAEIGVKE